MKANIQLIHRFILFCYCLHHTKRLQHHHRERCYIDRHVYSNHDWSGPSEHQPSNQAYSGEALARRSSWCGRPCSLAFHIYSILAHSEAFWESRPQKACFGLDGTLYSYDSNDNVQFMSGRLDFSVLSRPPVIGICTGDKLRPLVRGICTEGPSSV